MTTLLQFRTVKSKQELKKISNRLNKRQINKKETLTWQKMGYRNVSAFLLWVFYYTRS